MKNIYLLWMFLLLKISLAFCVAQYFPKDAIAQDQNGSLTNEINNCLYNKKILFLGSSVTRGTAANGKSFADLLEKEYNIKIQKEAKDGTTLTDTSASSYISRMKLLNKDETYDYIVVQLSTNDLRRHISLELNASIPPEKTIEGAILYIVEYLKKTYNSPIIFYTNPYFHNEKYSKMVSILNKLSVEQNFFVVDFYNSFEWKNMSDTQRNQLMADMIHPTLAGYQVMAEKFATVLQELCNTL